MWCVKIQGWVKLFEPSELLKIKTHIKLIYKSPQQIGIENLNFPKFEPTLLLSRNGKATKFYVQLEDQNIRQVVFPWVIMYFLHITENLPIFLRSFVFNSSRDPLSNILCTALTIDLVCKQVCTYLMNISITYVLSNSWFMFDEKPLEIFRSASSSRCNGIFTLALNKTLHHQSDYVQSYLLCTLIRCGVGLYGLSESAEVFPQNNVMQRYMYATPNYVIRTFQVLCL